MSKNNNSFYKGSEWRKWDLHVHTPASALEHSLGSSWDIYIERLIDAANSHKISAIATADYFTIDGYKNLLTRYNTDKRTISINGKSAELYLIPGVELRLNIFNSEEDSINLHIFFDPDYCSIGFITQNFLEELTIVYRGSTRLALKQQNLFAIGKSITDSTQPNYGQDFSKLDEATKDNYIRKAIRTITLSYSTIDEALKNIDEIFEKQNLPPKAYLIAVVGKGHGGISTLKWFEENQQFSRAGLIREHLTHQADIIFSNDKNDRNFYLGKRDDTPLSEIEDRFSHLKPCVWGSDADSLENLLHPSNGNTLDYTWIKADVSFEGLKQITFEPELRVRVQQDDPREEETFAKIEKLEINFPADLQIKDKDSTEAIPFCIQDKHEIRFSSNLTCVIGGRGSGKSTLIHMLYNLVPGRDANRLDNVSSPLFNLQLGSKDALGKVRSMTKSDIPPSTEFFLQNEVEKFAKDINEMSNLVRTRLYGLSAIDDTQNDLQQLENEWQVTANAVDQLISAFDEITRVDMQIFSHEIQKDSLKKQTDVISSKKYKKLQKEIEELASKISSFESYKKEYEKILLEISSLHKSVNRLDWSKYEGQIALSNFSSALQRGIDEIRVSYTSAKQKYDELDHTTKLNNKKAQLKIFLKDKGLPPESIVEVAAATQQIANIEEKIKLLQQEKIPYHDIYEQKEAVLLTYEKSYTSYKERFDSVTSQLQRGLDNLKFDEHQGGISFHLRTNNELLKDKVADFIKSNNPSKVNLRANDIKSVIFSSQSITLDDLVNDPSKMTEVVNCCEGADVHKQIMQELVNDPIFVEKLSLRMKKHHFDTNNIQVQTKLGEKLLQNTSFGERCGIVLAIALVAGTNPIIIDQPEDNLDGKYISNVIVPLIRSQKQRRQIILVTRDANIAISGDSELILILDKEESGTALLFSTIENKENRPKYIWILDGGEQAFQKREEKYCLQKKI